MQKIAIITGATSGIGLEFTNQLDKRLSYDELWLIARNRDNLEDLAANCSTPCRVFQIDLETSTLLPLVDQLRDGSYSIKTVVASAGFGKNGNFSELSKEDQLSMIDINCRSLTELIAISLPYMTNGGEIFTISSIAGFSPLGSVAIYAATKAYVTSLTLALRAELRERAISVIAVCPGSVDTNFQKRSRGEGDRKKKLFAKKSSAKDVVKKALKDCKKSRSFSTYGVTATAARFLRKVMPKLGIARFAQNKIYPKTPPLG